MIICDCFQIARVAFKNTKTLNRIQSIVFETAYKTNENLLICAPTGAGKTNIAMLTILHELKQHISQGVIKKDEFKVSEIYIWAIMLLIISGSSQCSGEFAACIGSVLI